MQLILAGCGDTGLRQLQAAFAPGAAAIADAPSLFAAGDPVPPEPLAASPGVMLIIVEGLNGEAARALCAALLDARPGRLALIARLEAGDEAESWARWSSGRADNAAIIDPTWPARDPDAFAAWFSAWAGAPSPQVFNAQQRRPEGPAAAAPCAPIKPEATTSRPPAGLGRRLKAKLLEGLWRWRHGSAVTALRSSPGFDAEWYLAANPDVAAVGIDPAVHYLGAGAREGRAAGPDQALRPTRISMDGGGAGVR